MQKAFIYVWSDTQQVRSPAAKAYAVLNDAQQPVSNGVLDTFRNYRIQPVPWSSRDQVIEELRQRGIGTSVHFIPLHLHPYYQRIWGYRPGDFPVAEAYFDRCISLPIYPRMTNEDVDYVIEALHDIYRRFRR